MSKSYWVEEDKKVNPHSPILMDSWPPEEENEKEEQEDVVVKSM